MSEWLGEGWMTECLSEGWMTECLSEGWMTEWMSEWLGECWMTECLSEWLSEGWMTEWMSEWLSECWMTEWISGRVADGDRPDYGWRVGGSTEPSSGAPSITNVTHPPPNHGRSPTHLLATFWVLLEGQWQIAMYWECEACSQVQHSSAFNVHTSRPSHPGPVDLKGFDLSWVFFPLGGWEDGGGGGGSPRQPIMYVCVVGF